MFGLLGLAPLGKTSDADKLYGPFNSQQEAAVNAANAYNPRSISEDREYIGAILKSGGKYYYNVRPGSVHEGRNTVKITFPSSYELDALWHTHGKAGRDRKYFSDTDINLSHRIKKPFYMIDGFGEIKVFRPGDPILTPAQTGHLGLPHYKYAPGTDVMLNNQPVKIKIK